MVTYSNHRSRLMACAVALVVLITGLSLYFAMAATHSVVMVEAEGAAGGNAIADATASQNQALLFASQISTPQDGQKPNASNSGVPDSVVLAAWDGPTGGEEGRSDLVISGVELPRPTAGYWTFTGSNLSFKDCKINGGVVLRLGTNIKIENCDITGGLSISGNTDVTVSGSLIHDFDDGIHITSDTGPVRNVKILNNLVHNPAPGCGAHADGMQLLGVDGLIVENNTIDMGPWRTVCDQDTLNAVFQIENTQGPNSNLTINHNWINGGGITARFYSCSNSTFTNNRFGRDYRYQPIVIEDQNCLTDTTGNVFEDSGEPLPL